MLQDDDNNRKTFFGLGEQFWRLVQVSNFDGTVREAIQNLGKNRFELLSVMGPGVSRTNQLPACLCHTLTQIPVLENSMEDLA